MTAPGVTTVTEPIPGRPSASAVVYGRVVGVTVVGVRGHLVTVEAYVGRGLPSLTFTGLPGAAVQDARERIRPAVEHAGLEWPLRRVVVNLAPGNLRKEGPGLDLPIAGRSWWRPARCRPRGRRVGVRRRAIAARAGSSRRRACCRSRSRPHARASAGVVVPAERRGGGPGRRAPGRRRPVAREVVGFLRGTGIRPSRARRRSDRRRDASISPRSAVNRRPAAPSRSRRQAATTSSWSARPARARRCSRGGSPRSFRRCRATSRSRSPSCTRWRGSCGTRAAPRAAVPLAAPLDLARGAARRWHRVSGPARSPSRTTGCCSWTSSPSSAATRSRALRQPARGRRVVVTRWLGPVGSRRGSPWSRRRTPARAGSRATRRHCRCPDDRAQTYRQALGPAARPHRHPARCRVSPSESCSGATAGSRPPGPRPRRAARDGSVGATPPSASRATPSSPVRSRDARRGSPPARASSSPRRSTPSRSPVAGSTARSRSRGRSRTSRVPTVSSRPRRRGALVPDRPRR